MKRVHEKTVPFVKAERETAGREFVQAMERGFAVMRAFSGVSRSLSISDVAQRTGLSRAVARRYLLTLCDLQCVQAQEGRFVLTPRVLDLGFAYLSATDVPNIAQPTMEKVVDELHESCSLAVLDGREILYIARVPAKRIMSINLSIGSRLPAHATSLGKVLLAHLPPADLDLYLAGPPLQAVTKNTITDEAEFRKTLAIVRQRGWALSEGEVEEGIRSISAPLWDRHGRVVTAINMSVHASRVTKAVMLKRHLPVLLEAARIISTALGGRPGPTSK